MWTADNDEILSELICFAVAVGDGQSGGLGIGKSLDRKVCDDVRGGGRDDGNRNRFRGCSCHPLTACPRPLSFSLLSKP